MKTAILCAQPNSAYHTMADVDVYDERRDARTFPGGIPVIAHPPCRAWSARYRHLAKPAPGEKELGLWCVQQVRTWGGILEQPKHSRLWDAAGLPKPGVPPTADSWSAEVWQAWWGFPTQKTTWLYFSRIAPSEVHFPLRLHAPAGDGRRYERLSTKQRSRTTPAFAAWLADTARRARLVVMAPVGFVFPDSIGIHSWLHL